MSAPSTTPSPLPSPVPAANTASTAALLVTIPHPFETLQRCSPESDTERFEMLRLGRVEPKMDDPAPVGPSTSGVTRPGASDSLAQCRLPRPQNWPHRPHTGSLPPAAPSSLHIH